MRNRLSFTDRNHRRQPLASLALLALILSSAPALPWATARAAAGDDDTTAAAVVPGRNGKITFVSNRDSNSEIYVMDADGANQTRLTNDPAVDFDPAWSPDGSKLTFARRIDRIEQVFVINADGTGEKKFTTTFRNFKAAWSPDGKKIVFQSGRDGQFEIYVMNADGSSQTRLTNNPASDEIYPAWSPDGKKISFTSNRDGQFEIYSMSADGSNQTRLTNNNATDTASAWSPDSTRITFDSDRAGNGYDIYLMNADGTGVTRLTTDLVDGGDSAWSPDGTKILFESAREGQGYEIFVMNTDGTGQKRLTNAPGNNALPDWQALPSAPANPIDDARFFVAQHYRDFLGREPDEAGLDFWVGEITGCISASCVGLKRQHVSAAFFLSVEFQETGYFVHRLYRAAYGRAPRRAEFLADVQKVGQGVVVGRSGWEQKLEANKADFVDEFAARAAFAERHPAAQTPEEYVDALNAATAGSLTPAEWQALVDRLKAAAETRATALRKVSENERFTRREFNPAFVLMQYFGYLRRNPDDPPDADMSGYNFWLQKLNNHRGNFVSAEMVKAFLVSGEYRRRFVPQ